MYSYEQLVERLELRLGDSLPKRLEFARLYWNPRNFDKGGPIKKKLDVEILFDEWIKISTGKNRWLLNFHDEIEDMSDPQEVMEAILRCKNWSRYSELWKRRAPRFVRSKFILLYALVDMTVQGGRSERVFEDRMRSEGRDVRKSSSAEDAAGIDFFVDGVPVQVKSEGTLRAARRAGKGSDWQ